MQAALDSFELNILRVRELHALHSAFSAQLTSVVDLSDMLRAEVVLAVSALDHFVHELTRMGMLECWDSVRPHTDAFKRFSLPMGGISQLSDRTTARAFIEAEIRARHGFQSFQHPEKIAEAIRLFSDVKIWDEVARRLSAASQAIKTTLTLIVDRRNKIAHESDIDPSYPGQRWPIDRQLVEGIIADVERIGRAIFDAVR